MEMPGRCEACGEQRMVLDAIHGVLACDACGRVGNQAETELGSEWQTGHVIERGGTYVGGRDNGVAAAKGLMRGQTSRSFYAGYPQSTERHRLETMKRVETITALLRVPGDKVDQAKHLLESTLDGDWGTGRWVDILVAACVYIVIRQCQLPLTVPEVADCVHCDVIELGRMYNRVLHKLEISLVVIKGCLTQLCVTRHVHKVNNHRLPFLEPNVDAIVFLERGASTLPALSKLSRDMVRKMTRQGAMLLDYAQECFITTGRRPLPVVAAVLSLVLEANKVVVDIAEVARELHAGLWATKKRYKECQTALVGIGQSLPWGKDITLKTVPRHLPFLLQYLELKAKLEKKKKEQASPGCLTSLSVERVPSSLAKSSNHQLPSFTPQTSEVSCNTASPYGWENNTATVSADNQPCPSKRALEIVLSGPADSELLRGNDNRATMPASISSRDDQHCSAASNDSFVAILKERPSKLQKMTGVSFSAPEHECQSNKDTSAEINLWSVSNDHPPEEDVSEDTESISTVQNSAKPPGLLLAPGQILKRTKWEGLPAAFCASLEARTRRRAKIDLAKKRISEARQALNKRFGRGLCYLGSPNPDQSDQGGLMSNAELRDKHDIGLDWEDLVIEHLVLSGANETELENGYYRSLLARYPEQTDIELMEDDPALYVRSRKEIELLLELKGDREGGTTTGHPPALAILPPTAEYPPPLAIRPPAVGHPPALAILPPS